MLLALVLDACPTFSSRVRDTTLDRDGVDGRIVGGTPMRGWGPDSRTMLTILVLPATGVVARSA
jgi:hypothetical protein